MTEHIEIKTIPLYNLKDATIENIPIEKAVSEIYYFKYRVPTQLELKTFDINETVDHIKEILSTDDTYIPLYDAFTINIYIVQKRNVYTRVVNQDYRFPDEEIGNFIVKVREKDLKLLAKNPKLKNDKVFMRSHSKIRLMALFMGNFDLKILYNTYLNVFYKYSPELGNSTYTCIRRSFIPHMSHLKPYYTKDEALKLSLNMDLIKMNDKESYVDFKDNLTNDDFRVICNKIHKYDVSADILVYHQNYIVKNDLVGLIQYYTLQGSYFMNQYLRGMTKYEYRNGYLEENIEKIWNLVLNAPAFDNDYILYRFVNTDEYLRELKIGDIYQDLGFMSTTRDPFYRNDVYKFGFILIKIKIPKKIKGVGLCLETLSHFPEEEEIILPPLTQLRLVAKDADCEYYHSDEMFVSNIKTRYEFEWIGNNKVSFQIRPELPSSIATKTIDFLTIKNIKTMSIKDKIDFIMKTYFDPMNRILCKIGDNIFYVIGEWFDSTGAYFNMYSLKTSEGFSLYSIYKGYILFMIEIGDIDGHSHIRVNYYTKYSRLNRHEIMGDDNFIKFISSIAYYFEIPNVIIYADYMSCDDIKNQTRLQTRTKSKSQNIDSHKIVGKTLNSIEYTPVTLSLEQEGAKKQRTYVNMDNNHYNYSKIQRKFGSIFTGEEKDRTNSFSELDIFTGGSYCLDFYKYLKYGTKRYHNGDILNIELQPLFSYYDLDMLKNNKPTTILKKTDRDEIYQIYVKNYILENTLDKDTLSDFYIWMIENKCYLMDIFIKKMDRLYRKENPFKKDMYVLDSMAYLYNRKYVYTYNRFIKIVVDETHQILNIPKNEYRIIR
jgi:hypothetical protein